MAEKNINSLDDHSLSQIFKFLNIDEWIELNEMTKRFRRVVREHVIPTQRIMVAGPGVNYFMNELFQMFGKCMTKLEFDAQDYVCKGKTRHCAGSVFEVFLQMLLDYCEPGKLKDVRIWNINENIQNRLIDQDFLTQTAICFKNVTSLRISFQCDGSVDSVKAMERWLSSVSEEQIDSLRIIFLKAGEYNFKLNPNSFPKLRNVWLRFEPSNNICLNKVTEFIRGKSNLQMFYCEGLQNEIVKTVAKFPNMKGLGIIDLNSKPEEIRLEEFKHLRSVAVKGSMANYKEFHNIFKIIASQKTLKYMKIYSESTDDLTISAKFLSFFKSDLIREKIYLEHLDVCTNQYKLDEEMYLKYLIINVLNFKTLDINDNRRRYGNDMITYKLIKIAVANVGTLENLVLYTVNLEETFYKKLTMEKLMINQRLGKSNRLTIYVYDAEKYVLQLGNHYDPHVIALEPRSKYVQKDYWR